MRVENLEGTNLPVATEIPSGDHPELEPAEPETSQQSPGFTPQPPASPDLATIES